MNTSPATVAVTPRGPRSNNRAPRIASSSRRPRVTTGWVTNSCSAARTTLPCSAIAVTSVRCRSLSRPSNKRWGSIGTR